MAFGNKGGGSRTGPKYPQQVTVGVTDEHLKFLKSRSVISLADALRDCIEECMKKKPGAAGELAGPSLQERESVHREEAHRYHRATR